jgi:polysaccharide pyruvyl transferase WcaK-like protein
MISVFDTTVSDDNLGNEIIMESVYRHLREVFPDQFFYKLPYMEITRHTLGVIRRSDLVFFGGTNSLTGRMERYKQWGISLLSSLTIRGVILMGLGWWQYQGRTSLYTKLLLRRVLSGTHLHSVRDSYTEAKLRELGFGNVVNTGCPTIWNLTPSHCASIPTGKADEAVMALTDYNQNPENDIGLVELLLRNYRNVYVWIQGAGDRPYVESIARGRLRVLQPTISAFDEVLSRSEVDYVGTRLHAGIRALQRRRRAIIISIDNRAYEMHRDFNIPVVRRGDFETLQSMIQGTVTVNIRLPQAAIEAWKHQFLAEPVHGAPLRAGI